MIAYLLMGAGVMMLAVRTLIQYFVPYAGRREFLGVEHYDDDDDDDDAEDSNDEIPALHTSPPPYLDVFRLFVTLLVLFPAIYVLLATNDDPEWATGAIGVIVGYWFTDKRVR